MSTITRNDITEHLNSRLDWQARVAAYLSRGGRKIQSELREQIVANRQQAYAMADVLGIDLNRYDGGK